MNREKIKKEAREKINENLWNILKPYAVLFLIELGASLLFIGIDSESFLYSLFSSLISIALYPIVMGCSFYLIKFVRNEPYDINMIFSYYKKMGMVFALYFLTSLFISLWSLLFIIPGIIAAISYSFAEYIFIDGNEDALACLKASKKMLMGYKKDYFEFILSFTLWFLFGIFTLGIGFIYVIPYFLTSNVLYYDELKKIS